MSSVRVLRRLCCAALQALSKREMFGKVVVVKAKPAKTDVKVLCVAALTKQV